LLNGDTVTAGDRDWNFDAAKAMHRNLVRMPRWALTVGLAKPPGWLANHVSQPAAAGLLQSDGGICWSGDESQSALTYHPEQGIIINREHLPGALNEESDESYD
jgi:hypothetical protein